MCGRETLLVISAFCCCLCCLSPLPTLHPSHTVVETTASYDPSSQTFELHTPNDGASKHWISQGCVADYAVVMADLRVGGKSLGPHAFLMQVGGGFRDLGLGV